MSVLDSFPDEPNTELCMCLVQEHDESFVLVWRPCPPNLCERPDHNHAGDGYPKWEVKS